MESGSRRVRIELIPSAEIEEPLYSVWRGRQRGECVSVPFNELTPQEQTLVTLGVLKPAHTVITLKKGNEYV